MFPEWHHAVPESAYSKVPEKAKNISYVPDLFCIGWQPVCYVLAAVCNVQPVALFENSS